MFGLPVIFEIDNVWSLYLSCFSSDILMTDGTQKPSSTSLPQAALQNLQSASAPSNSMTKAGYLSHFRWTHAVIAIGLLAASGAGTAVLFKVLHSKEPPIYHAVGTMFVLSIPYQPFVMYRTINMMQNIFISITLPFFPFKGQ